jgi:hypothetical protein
MGRMKEGFGNGGSSRGNWEGLHRNKAAELRGVVELGSAVRLTGATWPSEGGPESCRSA